MFPTLSFGDQEFCPEEMRASSTKVAGAMVAAGLKEGDTIALMLRNEPALMDVMLAARQLGLYYTPLNWHCKSEEAEYIVRDCGAKALFTHSDLFGQISDGIPSDVSVFALRPHPFTIASYNIRESDIPDATVDWAALVAAAEPLATSATIPRGMIAYTSGTTGRPKGVRRFSPSPEDAPAYTELLTRMFQHGCYLTAISSAEARLKTGSAGRPIEGVSIKIMDDNRNELAAGEAGKIYARHFATSRFTYINREDDRKAIENDGYVTVGDIGYLDDEGYLYVCDRRTDLVLSGGVNIYPAEIEQVLIGMPGVADCAVFGIPDTEFGQSLVAAVQPQGEASLTAQQVKEFLAIRLANFKVPRIVEFRDTLPREDTGKIFKRRLQEEYAARQS